MPKPRRRRRFFALEGRSEVDDTGEIQRVIPPPAGSEPPASFEDEFFATGENEDDLAVPREEPPSTELAPDEALPAGLRLERKSSTQLKPRPQFPLRQWIYALACLALGVVVGLYWPRRARQAGSADTSAIGQREPITLTPADQQDLDAAYSARHEHRIDEAKQIFTSLAARHPGWGPIEIEIGRTLFYGGKESDATAVFRTAVSRGWKPGEANFLLGVMYKARRSYPEAETSFAKAVADDPTEPEYYFFWAECLRDQGKLQEASAKFRSALLRNQYETAIGLYRAKLWLCGIEAGKPDSNAVGAEVDAGLAGPLPPMEVFIGAAARDLSAGDIKAAVVHLTRARERADPMVFFYVLNDPFFESARSQRELAGFFQMPGVIRRPEAAASGPPPANPAGDKPAPGSTAPIAVPPTQPTKP